MSLNLPLKKYFNVSELNRDLHSQNELGLFVPDIRRAAYSAYFDTG